MLESYRVELTEKEYADFENDFGVIDFKNKCYMPYEAVNNILFDGKFNYSNSQYEYMFNEYCCVPSTESTAFDDVFFDRKKYDYILEDIHMPNNKVIVVLVGNW